MPLDPHEAPKGYIAVVDDATGCKGCFFSDDVHCKCTLLKNNISCVSQFRDDNTEVIFVQAEGGSTNG